MSSLYYVLIKIAFKNVLRNWRHSLATFFTIVFGFVSVSLFEGFIKDLEYRIKEGITNKGMIGDVVIQKSHVTRIDMSDVWSYAMDKKEQDFIEQFIFQSNEVKHRVRFLHINGLLNADDASSFFMGYGYDVLEGLNIKGLKWQWDTLFGSPLYLNLDNPNVVVLGMGLAKQVGCEFADNYQSFILPDGNYIPKLREFNCPKQFMLSATTEYAQINALQAKVVGIVDGDIREFDKYLIQMPLKTAQTLFDTDKITMVSIQFKSISAAYKFIDDFNQQALKNNMDIKAQYWLEHQYAKYLKGGIQILHGFRNIFMIVLVLISIMSVTNTVMKSVNERIREIGTIRSLGFLKKHIVVLFFLEGLFIGMLACAVGLILSIVITPLVQYLGITHKGVILTTPRLLRLQFVPIMWGICFVVLVFLSAITSLLCSLNAVKMSVADALRYIE